MVHNYEMRTTLFEMQSSYCALYWERLTINLNVDFWGGYKAVFEEHDGFKIIRNEHTCCGCEEFQELFQSACRPLCPYGDLKNKNIFIAFRCGFMISFAIVYKNDQHAGVEVLRILGFRAQK